ACAIYEMGQAAAQRSGDLLLRQIRARRLQADELAYRIQKQYDREAGIERWAAMRAELQNQKETYKNLEQIRRFRLQESEAEARKNQLEEFLSQFSIDDAEIKGVGPSLKTALVSHNVVTAADLGEIKELTRLPSISTWRAESLLEWRRGLERQFV